MNQLEHLAKFVSELSWDTLPQEVKNAAKSYTLDTISVGLGAKEDQQFKNCVDTLLAFGNEEPADSDKGVYVWGTGRKANVRTATMLNAMLCHILELDDVHSKSKTHIGSITIAAAWTLADYLGKSGKEFLEAIVCGYETTSRIGMGLGVSSHRNKGWHSTATAGVFGATAACGKLLGLNADEMVWAFAHAGTQSCSTWAFITGGATNKILNPGRAAANGLDAALLAKAGMIGSKYILDADDGGLFPMMSDEYNYDLVDKDLGKKWEILAVDNKPYPCCRSSHCAIDAALSLRSKYNIDSEQIKEVNIDTYLVAWKQCAVTDACLNPTGVTDAKFSTPYVTAVAFQKGNVGLGDFTLKEINEKNRQDLLHKVKVHASDHYSDLYPAHWGCSMKIHLKNGQTFETEVLDPSGSIASPLTKEQLLQKAYTCCQRVDLEKSKQLFDQILNLDSLKKIPIIEIH